ncbi:MAG: 7-carboxy-7-deazaguanine synthase [Deltaproteobacteria bacterium]|nr:7-carboxy-7-deazaguanine synthase [Deltaproteobacteria bacterium]
MSYVVKEIFFTLQGEGARSGTAAVFCRFAACNLWSGREEDRASAVCSFCDTDFVGVGPTGGRFESAQGLARRVAMAWPAGDQRRFVVCTGGEPLLQLDEAAVSALHAEGFEVAIETNGTRAVPKGVDWVCVSPKGQSRLVVTEGDELKLVFPQVDARPELFESLAFRHFFLQPMDGPRVAEHTRAAIERCLANPRWRLSLQTHKLLGIP